MPDTIGYFVERACLRLEGVAEQLEHHSDFYRPESGLLAQYLEVHKLLLSLLSIVVNDKEE